MEIFRKSEEQIKSDFFEIFLKKYNQNKILGKIDLNWDNKIHFEFKKHKSNAKDMLCQVIVTTYQELYTNKNPDVKPPVYFGAVDTESMYLVTYSDEIFNNNAPYWNETPSNLSEYTKNEIFKLLENQVLDYKLKDRRKIENVLSSIYRFNITPQMSITKHNFIKCFFEWKSIMEFAQTPDPSTIIELFFSDIVRNNYFEVVGENVEFKNTLFNIYEVANKHIQFEGKLSSKNEGKIFKIINIYL